MQKKTQHFRHDRNNIFHAGLLLPDVCEMGLELRASFCTDGFGQVSLSGTELNKRAASTLHPRCPCGASADDPSQKVGEHGSLLVPRGPRGNTQIELSQLARWHKCYNDAFLCNCYEWLLRLLSQIWFFMWHPSWSGQFQGCRCLGLRCQRCMYNLSLLRCCLLASLSMTPVDHH